MGPEEASGRSVPSRLLEGPSQGPVFRCKLSNGSFGQAFEMGPKHNPLQGYLRSKRARLFLYGARPVARRLRQTKAKARMDAPETPLRMHPQSRHEGRVRVPYSRRRKGHLEAVLRVVSRRSSRGGRLEAAVGTGRRDGPSPGPPQGPPKRVVSRPS